MAKNTSTTVARCLYSFVFILLAMLLPFLGGQFNGWGGLWSMQIPVILCGFVCGPVYGIAAGVISPILRCLIFGAPVFMPEAVVMALELGTYAFVAGLLYEKLDKNLFMFYIAQVTSMVCGRLIWAAVMFILIFFGFANGDISVSFVWSGTVTSYLYGVILQLITIPIIVSVLKNNRLMLN